MITLKGLQTPYLHWPHAHDQVTIRGTSDKHGHVSVCLLGTCYSEFKSGPSLSHCADVAYQLFGYGWYTLDSSRYLGWRVDDN